jgi:hypothetical protein
MMTATAMALTMMTTLKPLSPLFPVIKEFLLVNCRSKFCCCPFQICANENRIMNCFPHFACSWMFYLCKWLLFKVVGVGAAFIKKIAGWNKKQRKFHVFFSKISVRGPNTSSRRVQTLPPHLPILLISFSSEINPLGI